MGLNYTKISTSVCVIERGVSWLLANMKVSHENLLSKLLKAEVKNFETHPTLIRLLIPVCDSGNGKLSIVYYRERPITLFNKATFLKFYVFYGF